MSLSVWQRLLRLGLALVVVTVVSGACASDDPQAQLSKVLKNTLRSSFAYEFALQADQGALSRLGPQGEQARMLFQGLNISGHRAERRDSLTVSALGIDAFELRSLDEDILYLRFGLDELSTMLGEGDSSDQMAPLLRERGLSDEAIAAVGAAFRGEWLRVEGGVEAAELRAALSSEGTEPARPEGSDALREALGGDVDGFVARYLVVDNVSGSDDERIFAVSLRVRDLVRAVASVDPTSQVRDNEGELEALPELAPGTVTARDGVVTNVLVDLADTARASGEQVSGDVAARLTISQHRQVPDIEPPPGALAITSEQFLEALAAVSGLVEELVPPMPAESAR